MKQDSIIIHSRMMERAAEEPSVYVEVIIMKKFGKMAAILGLAVWMAAGSAAGAYAYEWDEEEYQGAEQLETPGVWWDDTKAEWDEVEHAYQYEVRIYRDGYRVDTVKTKSTKLDCRSRMDRSGEYTFRVRARAKSGSNSYFHSDWSEESESYVVDETMAEKNKQLSQEAKDQVYIPSGATGPGDAVGADPTEEQQTVTSGWQQDNMGWWWLDENGTYPVSQWRYINGRWYYFNESGYMRTGWIPWNGSWYYCDSSGAMLTDTTTPDGYYVDGNGICR